MSHYPVCRWFHVTCSFVKRESEGKFWGDFVVAKTEGVVKDILCKVKKKKKKNLGSGTH